MSQEITTKNAGLFHTELVKIDQSIVLTDLEFLEILQTLNRLMRIKIEELKNDTQSIILKTKQDNITHNVIMAESEMATEEARNKTIECYKSIVGLKENTLEEKLLEVNRLNQEATDQKERLKNLGVDA
ncbi:MAG: hypothetical protein JHC93_05875 [Parachlamydiales bacterium]|nr:hypothetical protein [Parachlamydiales bacterium]